MKLKKLTNFLDQILDISAFKNDSSLNGLQVEGSADVVKVTLAVDACEEAVKKAIRLKSQLLIVHHGLFWGKMQPVTGIMAKRLRLLLANGISLYAAHLPLDCHPQLGNNARIASMLGIKTPSPFGDYHGIEIGLCGRLPRPLAAGSFSAKIRRGFGGSVSSLAFGSPLVRKVGIVSGGGASLVQDAAGAGCDTLLTGETSHSSYHVAREHRINIFFAGHYATETVGVKAVGKLLADEFGLTVKFVDIPTGL